MTTRSNEDLSPAEAAPFIEDGLRLAIRRCHQQSVDCGWWQDLETGEPLDRDEGELVALLHSELSEALEAERKNLMDKHLPHRPGAEVEAADFLVRVFDLVGGMKVDLASEVLYSFDLPVAGTLEKVEPAVDASLDEAVRIHAGLLQLQRLAEGIDTLMVPSHQAKSGRFLADIHSSVSDAYTSLQRPVVTEMVGSNLARAVLLTLQYGHQRGYDIPGALLEKLEYNRQRIDHTPEARREGQGPAF